MCSLDILYCLRSDAGFDVRRGEGGGADNTTAPRCHPHEGWEGQCHTKRQVMGALDTAIARFVATKREQQKNAWGTVFSTDEGVLPAVSSLPKKGEEVDHTM